MMYKPSLANIENRIMASNSVSYLPATVAMHCKKFSGQDIANMYQRTGFDDPLILRGPNPLAFGTINVYPANELNDQCAEIMKNVDLYYSVVLNQPLYKHYPKIEEHTYFSEIHDSLIKQNIHCNKKCLEDLEYQVKLKEVFKSVATGYTDKETGISYEGPFKDYPFKDALAIYICDKFLSVIKDPIHPDEFINTGYFGIAIGLGARYDLSKIEQLIKSIDPKKAGVPLDDINKAKDYLKSTDFYKELMATNRYLATICTMNAMFSKSDLTRSFLYTTDSSPYIKVCQDIIAKRKTIPPQKYLGFMKGISDLYCKTLETSDRTVYLSQDSERELLNLCNQLIPTSEQKK